MAGDSSDFVGKCRSRRCELGLLHRADGSARFQQGTHKSLMLTRVTPCTAWDLAYIALYTHTLRYCSNVGSTSVLAAVYGPVEVKQSKEKVDRAVVEITVKTATGLSGW